MKEHNKLVRGRIPEIVSNNGGVAHVRRIDSNGEFISELCKKLVEEAREVQQTPTIEELADAEEVLDALRKALGFTKEQLDEARQNKLATNGGFDDRIYLIGTEG